MKKLCEDFCCSFGYTITDFCKSMCEYTNAYAKIEKPKLIVVISVDQFRPDCLQKFEDLFLSANAKKNQLTSIFYDSNKYFLLLR